jgi:hypothetical protein
MTSGFCVMQNAHAINYSKYEALGGEQEGFLIIPKLS